MRNTLIVALITPLLGSTATAASAAQTSIIIKLSDVAAGTRTSSTSD